MTKLEILNKNISRAAQSKLGITYNQKIKKVALESMQEYTDQQLILYGVSNNEVALIKPLRNFIRSKHLSSEWESWLKEYERNL